MRIRLVVVVVMVVVVVVVVMVVAMAADPVVLMWEIVPAQLLPQNATVLRVLLAVAVTTE